MSPKFKFPVVFKMPFKTCSIIITRASMTIIVISMIMILIMMIVIGMIITED